MGHSRPQTVEGVEVATSWSSDGSGLVKKDSHPGGSGDRLQAFLAAGRMQLVDELHGLPLEGLGQASKRRNGQFQRTDIEAEDTPEFASQSTFGLAADFTDSGSPADGWQRA